MNFKHSTLSKSEFWIYFKKNTLIFFLPTIALSILIFIFCYNIAKNDTEKSINESISAKTFQINKLISSAEHINYVFFSDPYTKVVLYNNDPFTTNTEFINTLKKTLKNLSTYVNMYDYVDSIYLYCRESNYVYSNYQNEYLDKFFSNDWYEQWKNNGYKTTIAKTSCSVHGIPKEYLSVIYNIRHGADSNGAIVINFNTAYINQTLLSTEENDVNLYIYTADSKLCYSAFGNEISKKEYLDLPNKTNFISQEIISSQNISGIDAKLVMESNNNEFINKLLWFFVIIFAYNIFILTTVFLLSLHISRRYYESISDILNMLSSYEAEASAITNSSKELSYIKSKISDLYQHNSQNEILLSKKMIALKNSQLVALQTQINPHFILNSLNVINLMLMQRGELHSDVTKAVSLLAEVISNILSSKDYIISIDREIYYIKKYIDFAQIKFGNNFNVEWNIDPCCLHCKTVKFILQPIIENSVEHGFAGLTDRKALIKISVLSKGDNIEFIITDNGKGMTPEKRNEIELSLTDANLFNDKNMAIINVHKRIQIVFGSDYGCNILYSNNTGTSIKLITPFLK